MKNILNTFILFVDCLIAKHLFVRVAIYNSGVNYLSSEEKEGCCGGGCDEGGDCC